MKTRLFILFLTLLTVTTLAEARQVAYRDPAGQWQVIDEKAWPQVDEAAAKFTVGAVSVLRSPSGSMFEVTYQDVINDTRVGFDDPYLGLTRRTTLEAVLSYIGGVIKNSGSCQLDILESEVDGSGALAAGGPFFFTDGPYEDSLALIHLTTGIDPSRTVPDTQLTVDFGYTWNSSTGTAAAGKYDLFTVLLHEITHGLGLISLAGSNGASLLSPGVYSTYDNFLYTGNGAKIWNASGVFIGPASILTGSAGGVVFRGPSASDIYGSYPPIYTPSVWDSGSSLGHWNDGLTPKPVMSHSLAAGTENRAYQPFEAKALEDIGYTVEALGPEADLFDGSSPIANNGGPIDFGSALINSATLTKTFTLTNHGDQTLTTSKLSVPASFGLVNGLASSIEPGASDTFTIELQPVTLGINEGTVSFTTNDADENPYAFTIRGTVTAPSALVLTGGTALTGDSEPVDIGLVLTDSTEPSRTFVVRNTGTYPLETSGLTVPGGYSIAEPLRASIEAGSADSFTVQLATAQAGVFSGTVSFDTNDPENDPYAFAITGQVAFPSVLVMDGASILPGDGTPVDFGRAELNATGPTRTFTVSNSGSFPLETSGLSVPGGYSVIEPLASSIAPGGSDTVTVQLATSQTGTFSGAVSFATNDAGNNPVTFNATGQVVEFLSADPGWLDPSL